MKLEEKDMLNLIDVVEYDKVGRKTTLCVMILKNGFEIITSSSCINPESYNHDLGKQYSYQKAIDKLWELEGYKKHKE